MNQPPITRLMLKSDINNQLSDEDLILRYKSSEDSYYVGVLFERYMDVIFGISLKYLKNRHDAEDMLSVVFEKLLDVLLDKDVDRFKNWLYVLVKNQCVSKLRMMKTDQQRKQRYADYINHLRPGDLFGASHGRERDIDGKEERVREMLAELPAKQRQCVEYFYFENKTYKEIAVLLNEKVGKVRSYIQNGRRNLRLMQFKGK